jgi:hypothetical protein
VAAAGRVGGRESYAELVTEAGRRLAAAGAVKASVELITAELPDPMERLLARCEVSAAGGPAVRLVEVVAVADVAARLRALRTLLPALPPDDRRRALAVVLVLPSERLAEGLSMLVAAGVDAEGWSKVLGATDRVEDPEQRMRVYGLLAAGAASLPGDGVDITGLLASITDRSWYARALDAVVPRLLAAGRSAQALELARTAPHRHRRAALLAACAASLPGAAGAAVRREAYLTAADVTSLAGRSQALLLVAAALSADHPTGRAQGGAARSVELLEEALDAAAAVEPGVEPLRSCHLAAVAQALAVHGQVRRALQLVDQVVDEYWRSRLLAVAAQHARGTELAETLQRARLLAAPGERSRVLTALARRHVGLGSDVRTLHRLWVEALDTLASGDREAFLAGMCGLLPLPQALGGPDAVVDTVRAGGTAMRWWP